MSYVHRCIIVPAEQSELARVLCETLAGPGGSGMFTTPLSPTGQEPVTHYISAGYIEQQFADILPLTTITTEGEEATETTRPGQVATVEGMAAQAGVQVPAGAIAALLSAIDVTELDPFTAMARLGLSIAQEAVE